MIDNNDVHIRIAQAYGIGKNIHDMYIALEMYRYFPHESQPSLRVIMANCLKKVPSSKPL